MGLIGSEQLENLVEKIKSTVKSLQKKANKKKKKKKSKAYVQMDKSASVRVEIRSRKARRLIDQTLKAADHPGKTALY